MFGIGVIGLGVGVIGLVVLVFAGVCACDVVADMCSGVISGIGAIKRCQNVVSASWICVWE